mmetsp:Transcript_32802/g.49446  ORF Transcript_32802/g.49446 Transcript_32802/m.49446 type:complete len:335 (+) Transcript_32802:1-1005(+)
MYELSPRMQVSKRKNLSNASTTNEIMFGSSMYVIDKSGHFETPEIIENDDLTSFTKVLCNGKQQREKDDNTIDQPAESQSALRVTKKCRLTNSSSAVNLSEIANNAQAKHSVSTFPLPDIENSCYMSTSVSAPSLLGMENPGSLDAKENLFGSIDPEQLLRKIIQNNTGMPTKNHSALDLKNFFLDVAEEHISSYSTDIVSAVRRQDLDHLRECLSKGKTLQCCNRFGESILHMACRNGLLNVLTFLLEEADVSFLVIDDYGRTPLHDAFWTTEPKLDLAKYLISKFPDLLLVADRRGFTPLSYVRKDHWGVWCQFLNENSELLTPRKLLQSQE